MIIQTPESFFQKKYDAQARIDKYLLLLITFKNGLAFGSKFNERQSKPGQWLMQINSTSIIGGVGDLRDFKSMMLILSDFCQNTANILGEHYLTGPGVVNFTTGLLRKTFEEKANALAVNFIVADWRNADDVFLWFVDFDGSIKQLKNFAVSGGSEYEKPLTKEEREKLTPEETNIIKQKRAQLAMLGMPGTESFVPNRIYRPRKEAIAYLEERWTPNMKKEEAVELAKKTLFECNPESHDKTIEITVIEHAKDPEFLYFKKDKKYKKGQKESLTPEEELEDERSKNGKK